MRLPPHVTVSIIVPTYGRLEMLSCLVSSLLKQDFPARDYEIIVVDDGSPEAACRVIDRLAQHSETALRCLRKPNGGPASARTFGARYARGEYLIFVDDDMLIANDFVRGHIEPHKEVGRAAITCLFDWNVEGRPKSFERWYKRRIGEWTESRLAALRPIGEGLFEIPNGMMTTVNVSLAKTDYEKVGGFDAGYKFSCEDQDFGRRLAEIGVRCVVTARTKATHVDSHNTLKSLCQRQWIGARDGVRFMQRFAIFDAPECAKFVRINGPVDVWQDPWFLVVKKVLKAAVSSWLSPMAFGLIRLMERRAGEMPALEKAYDLIVAAYFRKGWCEGLRLYGERGLQREPRNVSWVPRLKAGGPIRSSDRGERRKRPGA